MHTAGIIAEYDPFHNGHKAHIEATRQNGATHVVVVISGSFTQRGEPAAFTKFQRAEMALLSGADLVLELPLPWSMASAERFALGGMAILNALGCVDTLSFGSECGDVKRLKSIAELTDTAAFSEALRKALSTGIPYAAARQAAAEVLLGKEEAELLSSPNNTLGLEYIRAANRFGADWSYFTLTRRGALHHENAPKAGFASGTLLREKIKAEQWTEAKAYVPEGTRAVLETALANGEAPADSAKAELALLARLRQMSVEDMARLPYLSEGLEHRLYNASRTATSFDELAEGIKTKRYPLSRIRRVLWAALLGISRTDGEGLPPYIRVLGMNGRGREILAATRPALPLLTRTVQLGELSEYANHVFRLEASATDLHALLLPTPQPCGRDYTQKLLCL